MIENQETKKTKAFTCKVELDATQAKEELMEIENQIEVVAKKYKEFDKLYKRDRIVRDVFIFLASVASLFFLLKDNIIYAIYYLILILAIGNVYKK